MVWKTQTETGSMTLGTAGLVLREREPGKDHHVIILAKAAKGGEYVNLTWTSPSAVSADLDVYFLSASGSYIGDACVSTNLAMAPEDPTETYTTENAERCFAPANAVKAEIQGFIGYQMSFTFTYAYQVPA